MRLLALLLVIQINCGLAAANEEFAIPALPTDTPIVKSTIVGRSFYNPPDIDTFIPLQKAMDQLRNNKDQAPELLETLLARADELPPVAKYYISYLTYEADPEKAVEWYWLASFQVGLDMALCKDQKEIKKVGFMIGLLSDGPAKVFLNENPSKAGAIGRKVLESDAIKSSMASPGWICDMAGSHRGLRGQQIQGADLTSWPDWLQPEEAAARTYEEQMEKFRKLLETMSPTTPAPAPQGMKNSKVAVAWQGAAWLDAQWLDNDTIVGIASYGRDKPKTLSLFRRGEKIDLLSSLEGLSNLCMSQGQIFVTLDHQSTAIEGKGYQRHNMLKSAFGTLADWQNGAVQETLIETDRRTSSASIVRQAFSVSSYIMGTEWFQDRSTCRWIHLPEPPLALEKGLEDWTSLGGWDGQLFVNDIRQTLDSAVYYAASPDDAPIKLWDHELPLACARHVPFLDKFLINDCQITFVEKVGKLKKDRRWQRQMAAYWLTRSEEGLKIEKQAFDLVPGEDARRPTRMLPTKAGLVRLVPFVRSSESLTSGGLYLYDPEGIPTQIWKGIANHAAVSPSGCKILLNVGGGGRKAPDGTRTQGPAEMLVLDVCETVAAS